jgi:M6 family metalloprotease-like protein
MKRMRVQKVIAGSLSLLLLNPSVWAVKHIKPDAYPKAKHDMIGHSMRQTTPRPGQPGRAAIIGGTTGIKNVAVIIVQFPAGNSSLISGQRTIQSLANIDSYFTSMHNYYDEVSNGNLDLQFRFFGTNSSTNNGDAAAVTAGSYTMPQPMEYYGCGDEGIGCGATLTASGFTVRADGDYLIRDALAAAQADTGGPDSTNGGGTFHAVLILHAGNGNETTLSTPGDIWSIFYSDDAPIIGPGGGVFTEGAVFPETESSGITSPLGVIAHEFGHQLGLPDIYNTTVAGGASVAGDWDLMDSGPYLGNGANPAHLAPWHKYTLGWSTPTAVSNPGAVTLGYVEDQNAMLKLNTPNGEAGEYFLVEYRSRTSGALYDRNLPGDGLLIWHLDEDIMRSRGIDANSAVANTVNSGSPHYGMSLVTSDGATISNANQGTAGNAFGNGSIFITPKSDNFAGDPSGVSIVNISGIGTATVSMDVAALDVSANQKFSKVANFPNPAGKGYAHPNGPSRTTLQFQITRPAQDYSINIYTLSGDLVRKIGKDDITLNIDRSADLKWVYEYEWDLTNQDGKHVAPGVYLYLMRADGESKSGKAVIIR